MRRPCDPLDFWVTRILSRSSAVVALVLGASSCARLEGFSSGGEPTHAGASPVVSSPGDDVSASSSGGASSTSSSSSSSGSTSGGTPGAPLKLAGPPSSSTLEGAAAQTSVSTTTQAGDLLVVAAYWTYGSVSASPKLTVTDSLGNTFVAATQVYDNYQANGGVRCKAVAQIFYAANVKAGADTITVTTSQPGNTTFGFTAIEYVGAATTSPLDDQVGLSTPPGGTNTMTAPALSLSGPRAVVVAVFTDTVGPGQVVPGPGFQLRGSNAALYAMVQDNLPGTTGAASVTATASLPSGATDKCWSVAAAGFKSP
jgi:hypothetical protein